MNDITEKHVWLSVYLEAMKNENRSHRECADRATNAVHAFRKAFVFQAPYYVKDEKGIEP